MKNILMSRLYEKNIEFKFLPVNNIYKLLNAEILPKRIEEVVGNSFDIYNIDNQTEENCIDTLHNIFDSLIKNQKILNYEFKYRNLQIINVEKMYPNLKISLRDHKLFFIIDSDSKFFIKFSKDNEKECMFLDGREYG